MSLSAMVTQLCSIESAVSISNGFTPRARDLNDTPRILSRGDCPQIVHIPDTLSDKHIAFAAADLSEKGRQDFTLLAYVFDQAENLDAIWDSRPRVVQFVDDLVTALHANPTLNGTATWTNVTSAKIADGLRYNSVPYRGAIIRLQGFLFV